MNSHDHYNHRILDQIDSGKSISQRTVARELGIALGLVNLLIKRLVKKGYVKTGHLINSNRIKYILTPKGMAEKSRLTVAYLENTVYLYTEVREKIRKSLAEMAREGLKEGAQRIVFYGAGEVAEIAFIALFHSGLELVAVVDDYKAGKKFFGYRITLPEEWMEQTDGIDWDNVVVTTFSKSSVIRGRLEKLNISPEKIFFL